MLKKAVDMDFSPFHGTLENSKNLIQFPYGSPLRNPTNGLK